MTRKGFLAVTMSPPPAMEEEFNDWYDTEHVPEREAISGFETVRRFVSLTGFPKYVAIYDIASLGVLDEAGYQSISGDRYSPWTKRILPKMRGLWRATGEQIYPGNATALSDSNRLLLISYKAVSDAISRSLIDDLRATFETRSEVGQLRVVRCSTDQEGAADYVALVEGAAPLGGISGPAFERDCGRRIGFANEYARYWAFAPSVALAKVVGT